MAHMAAPIKCQHCDGNMYNVHVSHLSPPLDYFMTDPCIFI